MQYTFRNKRGQEPTTITLLDTRLVFACGNTSRNIPYANIACVQMERQGSQFYSIELFIDQERSIVITNRHDASTTGALEFQSQFYSTFVRVLHFHLKDKSKAAFVTKTGNSFLWMECLAAAALSFGMAYLADQSGWSFELAMGGGSMMAITSGVLILFYHRKRVYSPIDIPLELLP